MCSLINNKVVINKDFEIYVNNVGEILDDIIHKKEAKVIFDDFYKARKKTNFYGVDEVETLYMDESGRFYLYITVPGDSYLSEMGIFVREPECVVVMYEEQALDYLEYRQATTVLLELFADKVIGEKYETSKMNCCFIKNRLIYDMNRSSLIKVYTKDYSLYGNHKRDIEELYKTLDGRYFLYVTEESLRVINSNMYLRCKEYGDKPNSDILPMAEIEAIKWFTYRGGNLERFHKNTAKSE
ncbi:hypothetical protein HMPREF1982_00391 [Clostridiales bacterium oral taxon 876 str. F0540]|nr:hypothetical protein HMPREF1982_00391 [Clostridiales bacterium oral taxon 876 str. F0540]